MNLCQQHQKEFDELPADEYDELCPHDILKEKKRNGSLTVEDLLPCYKPSCDQRQYKQHQCSYNFNSICWCADSEGNPTDGLFEKGQKVCRKYFSITSATTTILYSCIHHHHQCTSCTYVASSPCTTNASMHTMHSSTVTPPHCPHHT